MALQKDGGVTGSAVKRMFSEASNQKAINEFSNTRDNIDICTTKLKLIEEENKKVINDAKQQLTMLYNQAMAQLTTSEETEEKQIDNNMSLLNNYQKECNELRGKFDILLLSKDDKQRKIIETQLQDIKTKVSNIKLGINKLTIDTNKIEINFGNINKISPFKSGSVLTICGLDGQITNNGKTFETDCDCLARTDNPMVSNSGIYKIKWKIEILDDPEFLNCIGICTDDYKNNSDFSKAWRNTLYYTGWCGENDEHSPNGVISGFHAQKNNIFYKECKFIGDSLPQFKENDIIGLIYDSDKNILQYEYNGQIINSKLINIPKNVNLFWFAGRYNRQVKFSIIE